MNEPTKTPRRRGPKALLPAPVGIESINAATELAKQRQADLELLQVRFHALSELMSGAQQTIKIWEQTASERQSRIEALGAESNRLLVDITALRGRVELETRAKAAAEAHAANLTEGNQRQAEKIRALEIQVASWKERHNEAEDRAEALQVERDQWKAEAAGWEAEAKRYQISANNLGGMIKEQSRSEYHGPEADLPGGLLSGLPNPFRWLLRWIGGAK